LLLLWDLAVNPFLIRLTLCKILGSYSPVSEDSGVEEYDTVIMRVVCLIRKALHFFQMLGATNPVTQCHIPGDLNLKVY
jgi:hypothetical protein